MTPSRCHILDKIDFGCNILYKTDLNEPFIFFENPL